MKNTTFKNLGIVASVIFAVAMFRLVPYLFDSMATFNFSPMGAIALFGGAYCARKSWAFALPFLALWVSNLLIDNIFLSDFYNGFVLFANWEIYLCFMLIVGLGILLLKKVTLPRLAFTSLSASVLFFVVSNFLVWAKSGMYPLNATGLATCYTAAVPFFWNTLAGDLFFVALTFGVYELIKVWKPGLAVQNA